MVDLYPANKISFTLQDFIRELCITWKKVYSKDITENQAKLIFSKYCHETAGGKACWNNNIGNIKFRYDSQGKADGYFMLPGTWEIVGGKKIIYNPPHPATWFRHYNNLGNGILDYLDILNKPRYKKAFDQLIAGNLEQYAIELHNGGYYTDDPKNYINGLKRWQATFPSDYFKKVIENLNTIEKPIEIPEIVIEGKVEDNNSQKIVENKKSVFQSFGDIFSKLFKSV